MNTGTIRVASAQYKIESLRNWGVLETKIAHWVEEAANTGARLLAFPEYAALELVGVADGRAAERRSPERHLLGPLPVQQGNRRREQSLVWATDAIQPLIPQYLSLFAALAARHRIY